MDWTVRVVSVFVGSLMNYFEGTTPASVVYRASDITPDVIKSVVNGEAPHPIWGHVDMSVDSWIEAGEEHPLLPPYVVEGHVTDTVVKGHIEGDLRIAILTQGVGVQEDWDAIGRIVGEATDKVFGVIGDVGAKLAIGVEDPIKLRDDVRAEVIRELDNNGVDAQSMPLSGLYTIGSDQHVRDQVDKLDGIRKEIEAADSPFEKFALRVQEIAQAARMENQGIVLR
jgi:hypothetical protein